MSDLSQITDVWEIASDSEYAVRIIIFKSGEVYEVQIVDVPDKNDTSKSTCILPKQKFSDYESAKKYAKMMISQLSSYVEV